MLMGRTMPHEHQFLSLCQGKDFLQDSELPFVVALTKADKLSRNKQEQQRSRLAKQFGLSRDQVIVTSAQTGQGIDELKRRIEDACL